VSTIRMNVRMAVILSIMVAPGVRCSVFFCLCGAIRWLPWVLAFPCGLSGLLALPLCGAAL
jgi:hypothetical protein